MEMAAERNWTREHWMLILIILTPMALVLLATFIFKTGWGLPEGTRNQGVLLSEPVDFSKELAIKLPDVYFSKRSTNPWHFALVLPEVCDRVCEDKLWFARQLRTALGKYQQRVVNVAFVPNANAASVALDKYQPFNAVVISADKKQALERQHAIEPSQVSLYLIDPQGLAMMVYSDQHSYQQIIKDMKFLFKGVE